VIWVLEVILLPLDGIKMIEITNTEEQPTIDENTKNVKQWFADNNIDITGKKLSVSTDILGRVSKIKVDVDMNTDKINAFKTAFFDMSFNQVLGELHSLDARTNALERGNPNN